jgi:hypothetical protein
MTQLSDVFAYFYEVELATLDRIIDEAARVRIERAQNAKPATAAGVGLNLLPRNPFKNAMAARVDRIRDPSGHESLLPLANVETALKRQKFASEGNKLGETKD